MNKEPKEKLFDIFVGIGEKALLIGPIKNS